MRRRLGFVLVFGLAVTGCGGFEPFDPPVAGELNPEPGLFSGPTGEFVITRRVWSKADDEAATPTEPPAQRRLTDPPPP